MEQAEQFTMKLTGSVADTAERVSVFAGSKLVSHPAQEQARPLRHVQWISSATALQRIRKRIQGISKYQLYRLVRRYEIRGVKTTPSPRADGKASNAWLQIDAESLERWISRKEIEMQYWAHE